MRIGRKTLTVTRIVDVERVVIERRERAHRGRPASPSGARRDGNPEEEVHLLVHHRVVRTVLMNSSICSCLRQFAAKDQIAVSRKSAFSASTSIG